MVFTCFAARAIGLRDVRCVPERAMLKRDKNFIFTSYGVVAREANESFADTRGSGHVRPQCVSLSLSPS